jgi:glycosyltransferase involved in cell wall biosynthesis
MKPSPAMLATAADAFGWRGSVAQYNSDFLARNAVATDPVRFLGPVGEQSLVETYRTADLFVMPLTCQGFGVTFLEAITSGIRAGGLGVPGAKDTLVDGELGTIGSKGKFAAAITQLLDLRRPLPVRLTSKVRRFGYQRDSQLRLCARSADAKRNGR